VNKLASIISYLVIVLLMSPQGYAADLDGLVSSLQDGGYALVFRHGATEALVFKAGLGPGRPDRTCAGRRMDRTGRS
jgi:hypothetical protein